MSREQRLDSRGIEYEMSRDLTIHIMQYILNQLYARVRKEIIIASCVYEFGKKHEPTFEHLTNLIYEEISND